jgi:hypothetical protein
MNLDDIKLNLTTDVALPMRDLYTLIAVMFAGGLLLIIINRIIKK